MGSKLAICQVTLCNASEWDLCRQLDPFQGKAGIDVGNSREVQQDALVELLIVLNTSDHDPQDIVTVSTH